MNYLILLFLFLSACTFNISKEKQGNLLVSETEQRVRVRIIHSLDSINVQFLGTWQVTEQKSDDKILYDSLGIVHITQNNQKLNLISASGKSVHEFDSLQFSAIEKGTELKIFNVPYGIGWWWAGQEDRRYEGKVTVYPGKNGNPEVVVSLPLEDYLCGVIPYEMGGTSPLEALKAQAVAARSEAIVALTSNLYSGAHYDLTSDVECQVFSGNHKRTPGSDRAVRETRGLILTEEGKAINAYYASNCGGHSELIQNVWPEREPVQTYQIALKDDIQHAVLDLRNENDVRQWIESEPEVYCNPNLDVELPSWSLKNFRWKRTFTIDSLTKMISAGKNLGQLKYIEVKKRGVSGRAFLAEFEFEKEKLEVRGELNIRQMWQPPLRSSCFIVDKSAENFSIRGAGWGHGVGMCQSGAVSQALQGADFNTILKHYYPLAELKVIY